MMKLQGRSAIVTGGTKGIGRAIAEALLRQGVNVSISARSQDELERAASELSVVGEGRVIAAACDVRSYEEVKALVEHTVEEFGSLDILVNNAGIGKFGRVEDLSPE